jgi:hypothetical protein
LKAFRRDVGPLKSEGDLKATKKPRSRKQKSFYKFNLRLAVGMKQMTHSLVKMKRVAQVTATFRMRVSEF